MKRNVGTIDRVIRIIIGSGSSYSPSPACQTGDISAYCPLSQGSSGGVRPTAFWAYLPARNAQTKLRMQAVPASLIIKEGW